MSKVHELKCSPPWFEEVMNGIKPFEVRENDRDFQTGDILHLREYHITTGYTGRECRMRVGYILRDCLQGNEVVMAVEPIEGQNLVATRNAARRVRTAQRDYFQSRNQEDLIRAKQLEAELDKLLMEDA